MVKMVPLEPSTYRTFDAVVPLAPARQSRAKKTRYFSEQVARQLGPKASHSQDLSLLKARPRAPAIGLLQPAAQQQQPVAGSQTDCGNPLKWGLGPPPP